jgi:hypothetical protein
MHARLFLAVAIVITAVSIGCGGGGGGRSATHGVAAVDLAISPSRLDFGEVAVGDHMDQTGTLTAGNSSITVRSADWSGEGYSVSGIVFPLTIHAGQSVPFKVTFAPHRAGSSAGKINFESNAENMAIAAFSGNGTQSTGHSVTLAWSPATSHAAGYNVYRSNTLQGSFAKLTPSPHPDVTFTDASVEAGETYFYKTTAVSTKGKESKYSDPVQVTIPNS